MRTGSGLGFEEFWGVTPYGTSYSNKATSSSMVKATNNMFGTLNDYYIGAIWEKNVPSFLIDGTQMVMLREIVEKNKGSIGKITYNSSGQVMSIEVIMPKAEPITYNSGSDFKIINQKAIINAGRLMDDFNLTSEQVMHKAGDPFRRKEDAAMAFALMYHPTSKQEMQEYSASIDRMQDGTFTFTNVMSSAMTAGKKLDYLTDIERRNVDYAYKANSVGIIHTHWHPQGNVGFSSQDMSEAKNLQKTGDYTGSWYLVNKYFEVKVLMPYIKHTNHEWGRDEKYKGFEAAIKIFQIK